MLARLGGAGTISTPAGWSVLVNADSSDATDDVTYVFYKTATASEPATVTLTTTLLKGAALVYRITGGADPATQAPQVSSIGLFTTTANSANPPSITPTGGSKDYLFIALLGMDGIQTATAAPTNYTNLVFGGPTTGGTATNARIGGASRQLTGVSDDPGVFTHGAANNGGTAITIAIHPTVPVSKSGTTDTGSGGDISTAVFNPAVSDSGAGSEISTLQAQVPVVEGAPSGTVGDTTIETNADDTQASDGIQVVPASTGIGGKISSAFGYISGQGFGTGNQQIRVVLYADSAGEPGALLGYSDNVTVIDGAAYAWVEFPFSQNVVLPPSTNIWIGYQGSTASDTIQMRLGSVTNGMRFGTDAFANGPANPWAGTVGTYLSPYSLYAVAGLSNAVDTATVSAGVTPISATDSGAGSEISTTAAVLAGTTDTGSGTDVSTLVFSTSRVDSGAGSEISILTARISASEITADAQTVLLIHADGADGSTSFTDASQYARPITANGNAQVDVQAPSLSFNQSAQFDGSLDYLSIPDSSDFDFAAGDFTIDCWVKWVSGSGQIIYGKRAVGANFGHVALYVSGSAPAFVATFDNATWTVVFTGSTSFTGNWDHLAIVRSGNTWTLYLNGVSVGSQTVAGTVATNTDSVKIGSDSDGASFNGWIDEIRVSKGVARWTSNFTPPAAPYSIAGVNGVDTATVSVGVTPISATDSGSGSDISSIAPVLYSTTDVGAGLDVSNLFTGTLLSVTDSGIGSAEISTLSAALSPTESGTGSEISSKAVATIESGAGSEISALAVSTPVVDSGSDAEASGKAMSVVDAGVGSEISSFAGVAFVSVSDSGAGVDVSTLGGITSVSVSDSGAESEISILVAKFSVDEITPGASIGNQTVGANDDSQSADLIQVSSTSTGVGGKLISAFGYLAGQGFGTGDQQIRVVVYADLAGEPGTLLGYSSTVTIADGAAFAWVEFPFTSNVVLPPGSVVWIGYHGGANSDTVQMKYGTTLNVSRFGNDTFADGPLNPFTTSTVGSFDGPYSLYVVVGAPNGVDSSSVYTGPVSKSATDSGTGTDVSTLGGATFISRTDAGSGSEISTVWKSANLGATYGVSPGYDIVIQSAARRNTNLMKIAEVGATAVRIDTNAGIQTEVDTVVAEAAAYGLKTMLIIYANFTGSPPPAVGTFAAQQATKWLGDPRILGFEIGNEPDLNGWSANDYADFVSAVSDVVKAIDPSRIIIAGALWKGPSQTLGNSQDPKAFATALCARAAHKFDIFSFHGYDDPLERGDWNIWEWILEWGGAGYCDNGANGGTVRKYLNDHGHGYIPIISSENGMPETSYTEAEAAVGIGNQIDQATIGHVQSVWVYQMTDDDPNGSGMLEMTSDTTYREKPSYQAMEDHIPGGNQTEAGQGTEISTVAAVYARTDTGLGSEISSRAASVTDSGTGSDVAAKIVSVTETGTGDEISTVVAKLAPTDTGSGVEVSLHSALVFDSGSGSEIPTLTSAPYLVTDAGVGTENATVVSTGYVAPFDSGTGVEISTFVASLPVFDTAPGTDAVGGTRTIAVLDSGTGSEISSLDTGAFKFASDNGAGNEISALKAAYAVIEAVLPSDTGLVTLIFSVVDTGSGIDYSQNGIIYTRTEIGTATEIITELAFGTAVADAGSGIDNSTVYVSNRKVYADDYSQVDEFADMFVPISVVDSGFGESIAQPLGEYYVPAWSDTVIVSTTKRPGNIVQSMARKP